MLKQDELKKLDNSKLAQESNRAKKMLFETRFKVKSGQSKEIHKVKQLRKYVARVKTEKTAQSKKAA